MANGLISNIKNAEIAIELKTLGRLRDALPIIIRVMDLTSRLKPRQSSGILFPVITAPIRV